MKTCPRCQIVKPPEDYYFNRKGKISSYCKPCCGMVQKEWYEKNKARKSEINKGWRKRNPDRRRVMNTACRLLWKAIKQGLVQRGSSCEKCSATEGIEGAHLSYGEPLKVLWLCRSCHRKWDQGEAKSNHHKAEKRLIDSTRVRYVIVPKTPSATPL